MKYFSLYETQRQVITEAWFQPDMLPPDYQDYLTLEYDSVAHHWAIQSSSYVGIVPLTPDYGIQILPKSGLRNLTYMLYRSGLLNHSLETPFDETVPYQIPEDDLESFFEGLVESFLQAVDVIKTWGLVRESSPESQSMYVVRGKIDYPRWAISLPRTGGLPIPQRVYTPKLDNLPNRILRRCLEYLTQAPLKYVNRDAVLGRLEYFGQVQSTHVSAEQLVLIERQLETGRFPSNRYYYLPALNLALLIFRGAGLALGDDQDVTFKPILINTAYMFEKYIRLLCQEAAQAYDAHAEDGKQSPIPFYRESPKPTWIQPDVLIRRGGSTLLIADVKYKFAPTAQDHYQMWAYMHAHQIQRGGFISVLRTDEAYNNKNPAWFKRDQYSVFDYAFDCKQIGTSEQALRSFIAAQMGLVSS
ncbi:MAG: hypothetical protein HY782_00225 [Chloroflexi bacterium]|nr:hypothetical protein [Chloroflexota bacterium]